MLKENCVWILKLLLESFRFDFKLFRKFLYNMVRIKWRHKKSLASFGKAWLLYVLVKRQGTVFMKLFWFSTTYMKK